MRALLLLSVCCLTAVASAADRPNIVWISVEDISSHLGCYGDPHATTPNLDQFAEQSVRYPQAFTCHGVCAPCRTGIITGMYPSGLGANHMRSKITLPDHVKCFPEYLKQAGYYCTNNSKTDYNFHWKEADVWDESSKKAHWKNRPQTDQPFFAVFNLTTTHESRIWPKNWEKLVQNIPVQQRHDGSRIRVPPLYPDTPAVRDAHARLLDLIMVMDLQVGKYLQEIQDSGLADNTIVFFWSDHGNGFPRAKRWVYDSGTLVPLMVRIPESLRIAGQAEPGSVDHQLVNLIDLGPTVMNLAGVPVPDHMFGRPFLGRNLPESRTYTFAARDRVDERFDMVRSVRDKRFRYVRNFNPWRPALQHIKYSENSVVRQEMRKLHAAGQLPKESAQFLTAPRMAEELYDTTVDPWELNNLAADPDHAATLRRLRQACEQWQLDIRDAHLIPESMLDEEETQAGSRWDILNSPSGLQRAKDLLTVATVAATTTTDDSVTSLLEAAASDDAAQRWWAMHGLASRAAAGERATAAIQKASRDESAAVRIAAGRALYATGQTAAALQTLIPELQHKSAFVRHAAVNELDEMGPAAAPAADAIRRMERGSEYIGNVANHALEQFGGQP